MLIRLLERGRGVFFGLLLLCIATVVGGLHAARWASDRILRADAEAIATQWTGLLMQQFRNPAAAEGTDRGLHVEMISSQLLAAFRAAAKGADGAETPKAADDASDPGAFHRGKFVSQIFRYVIFGKDGAIFAKSGRFDDVHALDISDQSAGGGAFDRAAALGELTVLPLPEHIQRVFVPYRTGRAIPYIVAVDVDQYAAMTLLSGVMSLVMAFTGVFMAGGLAIPVFVAWRRTREILRAEDRLKFLALHDSLTGLPNRVQLREHLVRSMGRAERHGCLMAVLYLDLDRFKIVNDSFGHATGDALLVEVAGRLEASVRETDLVGRLGGDEFVVVAEEIESPDCAAQLADRIRDAIAVPHRVNGHDLAVSTSIGIAIGPDDGRDADAFLKNADLALARAKVDGRNRFRFFEEDMDAALQERRRIEQELQQAVRLDQLEVHYQPQFDLSDGHVSGYEALLRWQHPRLGSVPPGLFIPIAEDSGLISEIGEWVLRTATAYAATWPEGTRLAVNLSPAQFKHQDLVDLLERVLEETGFPAERLDLEITEGLLLQQTDEVIDTLKRLDALGISIAMDDFGTGYSSLSYLTRLPVRKIKIDRSFIASLGDNSETNAIVNTIVGLGQSLNVTITAEGVETPGQLRFLKDCGCDEVQGFLAGRPAPRILDAAAEGGAGASVILDVA